MSDTHTLALRNPVQVVLFNEVVKPALKRGKWKNTAPQGHAEPWMDVEVVPVDKENELGVDFEPPRADYNLLNKEFVEEIGKRAIQKVKLSTGEALTLRELRRELKDMMFIMRTPIGEPLVTPKLGLMDRPGRPSREALAALKGRLAKAKTDIKSKRSAKPVGSANN
jgi:hypothetical protein